MRRMHASYWVSFFLLLGFSIQSSAQEFEVFKSLEDALETPLLVRHLELRKDRLEEIPEEVWKFPNLEILDLGKNKLIDIPDSLSKLVHLRILILENNDFVQFPRGVLSIASLQELYLADCHIASIPEDIYRLENLVTLDMWHCDVEQLPEGLKRLEKLRELDLRQTYLSERRFEEEYPNWLPQVNVQLTQGCDCNDHDRP